MESLKCLSEKSKGTDNGASSYRRFREEGDESGLVEIIREYRDGLIFYLNSFVKDIHRAEELAEDTFILLGTKKPRDKGTGSFKTWLYTIGRNLALNSLKRKRRESGISVDDLSFLEDEEQQLERQYLKEEQKVALHHSIQQLKPEYQQILHLIYFEGFRIKDAAQVMHKSVHNTETLVYRARNALKLQLEKENFIYEEL